MLENPQTDKDSRVLVSRWYHYHNKNHRQLIVVPMIFSTFVLRLSHKETCEKQSRRKELSAHEKKQVFFQKRGVMRS